MRAAGALRIEEEREPAPVVDLGVSCFYAKAYLAEEDADCFLAERVAPLVERWVGPGRPFEYFFFIRYGDPRFHLRLRFFGRAGVAHGLPRERIFAELREAVAAAGGGELRDSRYRPERDRYGGRYGVRLAERLFAASSEYVTGYLTQCARDEEAPGKLEFAIVSCEALLEAVGLDYSRRQEFFRSYAPGFARKMKEEGRVNGLMNALTPIFEGSAREPRSYWSLRDPRLQELTDRFCGEVARFYQPRSIERIGIPLAEVASSYYHMQLNRIGISPAEEMIIRHCRKVHADGTSTG